MKCKESNEEKNQIKAGKIKAGTQKYKSKYARNITFLTAKIEAIAKNLYMEGNSSRAVG